MEIIQSAEQGESSYNSDLNSVTPSGKINFLHNMAEVLVIDDEIINLKFAFIQLNSLRIPCDLALCGNNGLQLLKQREEMRKKNESLAKIKLVLVDFEMPLLTGI